MAITHKYLLYWLLYLAVVAFLGAIALLMNLPYLVIANDHSYLSVVLLIMYLLAETLSGRQAIWISDLHRSTSETLSWLRANTISKIRRSERAILLQSGQDVHVVKRGPLSDLLGGLLDEQLNSKGGQLEHVLLVDSFAENLDRRTSIGDFIATRIVWIGILATIVGVIMAFWPFQGAGMTVEAMRANLGQFFSGVAVAFIPTAVSFVFKIALDINSKIVSDGVSEIIEMTTAIAASHVIPHLEQHGDRA